MARRSDRVLAILRAGFLSRIALWQRDTPRGLELFNRVRSRYPGLTMGEYSTLYQTGISAVNAGGILNRGDRLFINNIPTIPGLPSPFGTARRFVYEVTVEFRVDGIPGMVGPLFRKRFMESDSVLSASQLAQRSEQALWEQFANKPHYRLQDRGQLTVTDITVQTVAARF